MSKIIQFLRSLKIRDKLILYFICLIIVPIFIIFLITYVSLTDIVKNKISNYGSVVIRNICDNIDESLSRVNETQFFVIPNRDIITILTNTEEEANQAYINRMQGLIMDIINTKRYVVSITFMNNNGFTYFNSRQTEDTPYSLSELKQNGFYDKIIKANGRMVWGKYDKDKNIYAVGTQILSLGKLENIGLMIVTFDMRELGRIYSQSKVETSGKFIVADNDGNIIFNTDKEDTESKISEHLFSQIKSKRQHVFFSARNDDEHVTISYPSNVVDWLYIYEVPEKEMMKDMNFIRSLMILVFSGGVVLAIVFSVVISFGMTRPIKQLRDNMNKAEKGNLDVRVKIKSNDEIGQLGDKFNKMIKNIQNLINTVYKEELMRKNAEFEALQAQINPHFLYNTLDSINALAELKGVDEISKIAISFSKLLRASISNKNKIISLREEISYIVNYMTIINIRYNNKIDFIMNLQEETLECKIPKLIIQPLVENAIVHGLDGKVGERKVIIRSWFVEDELNIQVKDNGVGMDIDEYYTKLESENENSTHNGVGLDNVKRRIELMYGSKYGVTIDSKIGDGTSIIVRIPKALF